MLSKERLAKSALLHTTQPMSNTSTDTSNVGDCDRKSNSCVPGNLVYESGYKSDSSGTGV